jgi:hypothetical protein
VREIEGERERERGREGGVFTTSPSHSFWYSVGSTGCKVFNFFSVKTRGSLRRRLPTLKKTRVL